MFLLLSHTIMLALCVSWISLKLTLTCEGRDFFKEHNCRLAQLLQHPRDCSEVMEGASWNKNQSGVYLIKPDGHMHPFEVYCDTDVENVPWTVIQRRNGGFISFNRGWNDYKHGFGFLGSEFWLGLDKIGFLTNQKRYQLRVDLFTDSSVKYHLYYNFFRITDEWENYTLGSDIQLFISTPVRLAGGSSKVEGRVEVYHDGQWGAVCDTHWNDEAASVVCRQLGYSDTGITVSNSRFGEGSGPIWIDVIACSGVEGSIDHCGKAGWGSMNCNHGQDAALRCVTVRLTGGAVSHIGRVEVFHNGQWGTICDDRWDDVDASVVCRQLGYGDNGRAVSSEAFGVGSGIIWLDELSCDGSEDSIERCTHNPWGENDCSHSQDAGVFCSSDCPTDTVLCYNQLKEVGCSAIENCSCYLSMENITIPAGGVYLNSNCTERGYCLNGTIIWNYIFTCDSNAECQKQQYQGHRCHCKAGYHGDGDACSQLTCCQDIYDTKSKVSDVYFIKPINWSGLPFQVYCDMSDGGWTVFQRRLEGSVDFYRGWNDYKDGFGDLRGEHWLGNEKLHYITSQKDYELKVDMTDNGGDHHKAVFNLFRISSEEDMYRLNDGNEGSERNYGLSHNRGNHFSTFDRDNDPSDTYNCASRHGSGWWFASDTPFRCHTCCHYFEGDQSCTDSNLNGRYGGSESQNLFWYGLPNDDCNLRRSEMKLRPVQ